MLVLENGRAIRNERLHPRRFRHRTFPPREERFDARENFWIRTQRPIEKFSDQVAGTIVGSRTESAGSNYEDGTRERFANGGLNIRRSVVNGNLASDDVTAFRKFTAKPLLVRIEDVAEHQLAAGVDNFDIHSVRLETVRNPLVIFSGFLVRFR